MYKKLLRVCIGMAMLPMINTANASLLIDDLSLTTTSLVFNVTGTVDVVGTQNFPNLFFGFVDSRVWHNGVTGASGFSKNSGDYDFGSVSGATNSSNFGTYVFTNGTDVLQVGDIVDISYSILGSFNTGVFDANSFVVQAGFSFLGGSDNLIVQESLVTGGTVPSVVPVPAALPLFGTGLAIMGFIGWRRKRKIAAVA